MYFTIFGVLAFFGYFLGFFPESLNAVNTGGPYLGAQTKEEHEGDYLISQLDALPMQQRQQVQELLQIINNAQEVQNLKVLEAQLSPEKLRQLQELQAQLKQLSQLQQLSSISMPLEQLVKLLSQKLQEQKLEIDRQFNYSTVQLTPQQRELIQSPQFLSLSDKQRLRELFKIIGVNLKK